MEQINWNLLPAEELDRKVDEILAGNDDITDEMAQQILLRHAELVKRGAISPSEGYLARKKAAQRVMVPNTNFLKQVLKQTIGVAPSESRSGRSKRARSPSTSDEQRAPKRHKSRAGASRADSDSEREQGPQPARVMRGRGSSGAAVLDAVFESQSAPRDRKEKDKKKKHKKDKKKKHKKDKKKRH